MWSDGTPVTSAEYCLHPEGGCAAGRYFSDVASVEALDELTRTADAEERARIARKLNDSQAQSYASIPVVHRGSDSGISNTPGGVRMNPWDTELWNIADWSRTERAAPGEDRTTS